MTSVLYISYDGLGEALGQAQVLEYLLILAKEHRIALLTFEKPNTDPSDLLRIRALTNKAGIHWVALRYHKKFKLLSAAYDSACALLVSARLILSDSVSIVHARGYLPATVGLALKLIFGCRLLFDMRGFWADQRADCGAWDRRQPSYRLAKLMERILLRRSDYIVSLTASAIEDIRRFPYLAGHPLRLAMIPTCVNLDSFSPAEISLRHADDPLTIGMMGNVTVSYRLDDMALAFAAIRRLAPTARLLALNRGDHPIIRSALVRAGVSLEGVECLDVPYRDVSLHLRRLDGAIFFLKEFPSMSAVCPTRLGEFLACGVPILTNGGYGDAREIVGTRKAGVIVDDMSAASLAAAAAEFLRLCASNRIRSRCRAVAEEVFSLEKGARCYSAIYRELGVPPHSATDAELLK